MPTPNIVLCTQLTTYSTPPPSPNHGLYPLSQASWSRCFSLLDTPTVSVMIMFRRLFRTLIIFYVQL